MSMRLSKTKFQQVRKKLRSLQLKKHRRVDQSFGGEGKKSVLELRYSDFDVLHVSLGDDGRWRIDTVVEGDTVNEVLGYVQFDPDEMRAALRQDIETALEAGRLTLAEGASLRRFLDDSLQGYTYLE
jgi:hypothetical protein